MRREQPGGARRNRTRQPITTASLFSAATARLRRNPRVLVVLLLAGAVVAGVDWLQLHGPVPVVEYAGITDGEWRVAFDVMVAARAHTGLRVSALQGLSVPWFVVTVGLELFALAAVTLASVDALGRLLDRDPTPTVVLRYGLVVAVLWLPLARLDVSVGSIAIGLPLLALFVYLLARLVPLPGRLVHGAGIKTAIRRSWRDTRGHARPLIGVVLVVGVANHLAVSLPVVGPVGSGVVAAVHAGIVAAVVDRVDVGSGRAGDPPA